jgi:hypothetical protein
MTNPLRRGQRGKGPFALSISIRFLGLLSVVVIAACGGGGGQRSCTEGQSCGAPTACRNGVVSCSTGTAVCVDSGNAADGTACTSGGTCQAGTCKRTVSGTFQTIHWTDDGTKTTVSGTPTLTTRIGDLPAAPSALLVADASVAGYTKFPVTLGADQSFAVSGVPVGSYFLELDATTTSVALCGPGQTPVPIQIVNLFELRANAPDLAAVTSTRPDVVTPQSAPAVTFDVSNMDAWGTRDRLFASSAQAQSSQLILPGPATGATLFTTTSNWIGALPDASKGDTVYVYQRHSSAIGSGPSAGLVSRATKSLKLTNLTVSATAANSATVALATTPQTGALATDVRNSQAAAIAADVNPSAVLSSFSVNVVPAPHSITYPDMPLTDASNIFALTGTSAGDVDYGTVAYGQFFDPIWKEEQRVVWSFDVPSEGASAFSSSNVPVPVTPGGTVAPLIGPPKSPRVNGANAFTAQTGVGLQPTISWSAPALGTATSYTLDVTATDPCGLSGQIVGFSAVVHNGTSFKVPSGILKSGFAYRATITARQAAWDTVDAGPFRTGSPRHVAQCVTSTFAP